MIKSKVLEFSFEKGIEYLNSLSSKLIAPLRRSSRIRRAPIKCVCATCIATKEHLSSTNEAGLIY